MHEHTGESELLFHAAGEVLGSPGRELLQTGEFEQPLAADLELGARYTAQLGEEREVLRDTQVRIQAEALRHVADARAHRGGIREHRLAEHERIAARGPQRRGEHPHERGLARAVRSDQPEHGALGHLQRHAVHCRRGVAPGARKLAYVER